MERNYIVKALDKQNCREVSALDNISKLSVKEALNEENYKKYKMLAFGVFTNNKLIGYCILANAELLEELKEYDEWNKDSFILMNVFILPEYRRMGAASKLIEEAIKQHPDVNDNHVFLIAKNTELHKLYTKAGFIAIDDYVMIKEDYIEETKRSNLPDEAFGIPEERKYPLDTKEHVLSAIKLFGHVEPKYEKELAGNIIKKMKEYDISEDVVGEKNKLRKYIDNPELLKESTEYVEESVFMNRENIEYNLDKFESEKSNILIITGLSGSGKSTLAKQLASKHKAEVIEIDIFDQNDGFTDANLNQAGDVFVEYLLNNPEGKKFREKTLTKTKPSGKELSKCIREFCLFALSYCKKHKETKYIIEGMQIYSDFDFDEVKSYPMIIVGTSMVNSILRRFRRNNGGRGINWADELTNEFIPLIRYYWDENKKLENFKKDYKNESFVSYSNAYPIYLVTSFTFTGLGKIITDITNSNFSHAAIAFDDSLEKMYTFNSNYKNPLFDNGLAIESIDMYRHANDKSTIQVTALFLKKKDYDKLKSIMDDMLKNSKNYSYHFLGLIDVLFNKKSVKEFSMICSEFVARLLSLISIDISNGKELNLVSPKDIALLPEINNKMYIVFNGYVKEYSKITISKIIKSIIPESEYIKEEGDLIEVIVREDSSIILETKEFPVDFDKDGNLIIKNYKKLNFEEEYSKSHKLLMLYAEHENLEGIKYELSKLWFMNIVLEKRIYSNLTEEELQKYTKVRARILNDFNKYLAYVLKREPDFNFTEYYNKSPFSDVDIKISGTLLRTIGKLIGQLL